MSYEENDDYIYPLLFFILQILFQAFLSSRTTRVANKLKEIETNKKCYIMKRLKKTQNTPHIIKINESIVYWQRVLMHYKCWRKCGWTLTLPYWDTIKHYLIYFQWYNLLIVTLLYYINATCIRHQVLWPKDLCITLVISYSCTIGFENTLSSFFVFRFNKPLQSVINFGFLSMKVW